MFDISTYNNSAKYANLSEALNSVPQSLQKGGMSIKFIQTTPAKYTVVKTEGATEQPAGTEIQSDPGISSGTYTASGLSAFDALPATLNSSLTYYLAVTETVDEQEVTTYTTWVITYAHTYDNKYVQYRLVADEFTTDTTQWTIADEGVYVENPEFVKVYTDKDDKILWAIKADGNIYYGAGVPQQIIDYIEEKIADLSLDEYEDIVAFLSDYLGSDTTLKAMIDGINASISNLSNTKVDKEEGKSLIDEDYSSSQSAIDNPEFLEVTTDSGDKVLEGIQKDGTKVIGGDTNVRGSASISGNLKVLGNMNISGVSYKVIESPEYLVAWVDAEDKVIFGLKTDGKTYVGDADFLNDIDDIKAFIQNTTDKNIDWDALSALFETDNPEYLNLETDAEGKILAGRTPDGAAFEKVGFTTPKVSIDGHTIENIKDPEGRSEVKTDGEGKIISYRDGDGVKHEEVGIESNVVNTNKLNLTEQGMAEFQQALINAGFNPKSVIDWSDQSYIHIPTKPTCAVINITGIDNLPQTKGVNSHAWMEVWDKNGNYFKKRVILDAQGRSSLQQAKKNFAADFCEDEWEGDDTTTIKIGDWVSQDSFHFKAYYTDLFKMANIVSYKLWENFKNTMPFTENKPYKEYFATDYSSTSGSDKDFTQNTKDEAKCVPDGFPVMVYLNGDFYGLFSWQLKKHRDNYLLDRNATDNIHLDGESYTSLFNGNVIWTNTEIRNPKPKKSKWTLYCMDGSKYDGDNPKELIDDTSENWDGTNTSHVKSAQVKENILAASQYMSEISPFETAYNNASSEDKPAALEALKAEIEKRFGVKWMIDYVILINLEKNGDSIIQNTQWITWGKLNGKMKWYPCPYDLDASFGIISATSFNFTSPGYVSIGATNTTPIRYVYDFYQEELKARWKELRDKKIIDKETLIRMLKEWIDDIGNDNLSMEYDKWSESPCNRDASISNKWEMTDNVYISYSASNTWYGDGVFGLGILKKYNNRCYKSLQTNNHNHRPDISPEWWEDVTVKAGNYAEGDVIYDGYNNFYEFRAKESIVVTEDATSTDRQDHLLNTPFTKLYNYYPNEGGVYDSIYRIYKWIEEQIALMDSAFNYNQN